MGNTCMIDPWSVAGLAATILGVAGTILAVFGAVAVAAWWTMLNKRVSDQVTILYGRQKREVNTQVDTLLAEQKQKIDVQLTQLSEELEQLRQGAEAVEDITIDGLMAIGAPSLEAWAKKAIQKKRIPHLPLRMATGYLDALEYSLPTEEQELKKQKKEINQRTQAFQQWLNEVKRKPVEVDIQWLTIEQMKDFLMPLETKIPKEPKLFEYWNQATYWLDQAKQEEDPQTCEPIEERLQAYQSYVENYKLEYEQLRAQTRNDMGEWLSYLPSRPLSGYPRKTDASE